MRKYFINAFASIFSVSIGVLLTGHVNALPVISAEGTETLIGTDDGLLWSTSGFLTNGYPTSTALGRSWSVLKKESSLHGGIDADGHLWTWGSGMLGVSTPSFLSTYPIPVGNEKWKSIGLREFYSFGVRQDGTMWRWGQSPSMFDHFVSKVPIRFGDASNWSSVSYGTSILAIQDDGSLWGWGSNSAGTIGDGTLELRNSPVRIGSDNDWRLAISAVQTSYGIKNDGSLWVWGKNSGNFGNGFASGDSPFPIQVGTAQDWVKIAGRQGSVVGIRADGSLWSWGSASAGVLGLGSVINQYTPARIGTANDWVDVAAGSRHAVATRSDGSIWAWGDNDQGQLALNGRIASQVPIDITSAFTAAPRFVIYKSARILERNNVFSLEMPVAIHHEPTAQVVEIRNNGFAAMSVTTNLSGVFSVISTPTVNGLSDSSIRIELNADAIGAFTGQLRILTNDPGRPEVIVNLSGDVISAELDSDGDGLSNGAEAKLAPLGFDWKYAQPDKVRTFFENVGYAGLYREEDILDVEWKAGTPVITATGETIQIPMDLTNPADPSTRLLTPAGLHETPEGALNVDVPLPPGKRFLRIKQP